MANQPEVTSYDAGVYQLEITDPVDGGVGAKTNAPLLALSNRTNWLKKHIDDLEAGNTIPDGIARINSPPFTGTPTAPTQAPGDDSTRLATDAFVQAAVNGQAGVSIAGNATTTLTQAQWGTSTIVLTGAVTGNKAVVFPSKAGNWQVINNTTGNFTVTLKTAAGTGVVVTRGNSTNIYCDGANIWLRQTDFISPALTGTPTAPTATIGTNNDQIATMAALLQGMAAFGLGSTDLTDLLSLDMNNLRATGFYQVGNPSTNMPPGMNSGVAIVATNAQSWTQQLFLPQSRNKMFQRCSDGANGFTDWREIAGLDSPVFTGNPTAPTPALGDSDTSIATTEFVQKAMAAFGIGVDSPTQVTDLNTATAGGAYRAQGGAANSVGTGVVTFLTIPFNTGGCCQVLSQLTASGSPMWYRAQTAGNWSAWQRFAITDSPTFTGTPTAPTPEQFATGDRLATLDFLNRRGVEYRNIVGLSSSITLTADHVGCHIVVQGPGAATITLPLANSVAVGATITLQSNTTINATNTIARQGTSDTIIAVVNGVATSTTSFSLLFGDTISLTSNGNSWYASSNSTAAFIAAQFLKGQSLASNGYLKIPGGLVIQWGTNATDSSGSGSITLPTAFANLALAVYLTPLLGQAINATISLRNNSLTKTSFAVNSTQGGAGASTTAPATSLGYTWLAIGY